MSLFRKTQKEKTEATRRKRLQGGKAEQQQWSLNSERTVDSLIYFSFAVLVVLICFYGLAPMQAVVRADQISRTRVVAEFPFQFVSEIQTEQRREEQRRRVPPVYRISLEAFNSFASGISALVDDLSEFAMPAAADNSRPLRITDAEVQRFLQTYGARPHLNPAAEDLALLINELPPPQRREALREGLIILGELNRQGILDGGQGALDTMDDQLMLFNVLDEVGRGRAGGMLSQEDALRNLRIHLAALDIPRAASIALFRLLRDGLEPNLEFDEERTQTRIAAAMAQLSPVVVNVREGDTLIEPNVRVTALQFERYEAYRKARLASEVAQFTDRALFWERTILTLILVAGIALYIENTRTSVKRKRRLVLMSAAVIVLNLLLFRFILNLGHSPLAEANPTLLYLLSYLMPVAVGPMILSILVGAFPAFLAAAFLAVVNAMMQGNSLFILIASMVSALFGIYLSRNIQVRTRVVKAGFFSGVAFAVAALLLGMRDSFDALTVLYQALSALGVGLLTGVIVVGFLPVLESLFRYTTDITLLELTDYNHPLLRKLQVEAPGSYHHSLMVANLSENAASAIGASALICRVCSLYHDIGKVIKPEYFVENQREGYNPHIERNPSMSALVIKSHVKEGITLARQYKLPRIIQDVIQQHHGTSLIQYFYYKAIEKQRAADPESALPNAPRIELDKVNESTYRYEGPKPQFNESAIIMLADSVEAAGRSLRKVTPQSIAELVDKITIGKLNDGQFDETPITLEQLTRVKESFVNTMLSMLHSRVEYPEAQTAAGGNAPVRRAGRQRSTSPFVLPPDLPSRSDTEPEIVGDILPAENSPGKSS